MEQSNQFGVPAPKAGALPTALHLGRFVFYAIPNDKSRGKVGNRGKEKQESFPKIVNFRLHLTNSS